MLAPTRAAAYTSAEFHGASMNLTLLCYTEDVVFRLVTRAPLGSAPSE